MGVKFLNAFHRLINWVFLVKLENDNNSAVVQKMSCPSQATGKYVYHPWLRSMTPSCVNGAHRVNNTINTGPPLIVTFSQLPVGSVICVIYDLCDLRSVWSTICVIYDLCDLRSVWSTVCVGSMIFVVLNAIWKKYYSHNVILESRFDHGLRGLT